MKPFKTEGDAWRSLAQAYEQLDDGARMVYTADDEVLCHSTGLCQALRSLFDAGLIDGPAYKNMTATQELLHDHAIAGWWWPFGDVSVRALACAFLAVLADKREPFDA